MEANAQLKDLCDKLNQAVEGAAKISPEEMLAIMRRASEAEDIRYAIKAIKARN